MGAAPSGPKERIGLWDGARESAQSWKALWRDLQSRGLAYGPAWAMGDGALGFWQALRHVSGQRRWQRCWGQKTAHGLAQLPQALQPQANPRLQTIGLAPDRQGAERAFEVFVATSEGQYPHAAAGLAQEREVWLTFADCPAAPWGHMRPTTPIAATYATGR